MNKQRQMGEWTGRKETRFQGFSLKKSPGNGVRVERGINGKGGKGDRGRNEGTEGGIEGGRGRD